ncbi:glycosyltransferase [candidate division KSB1 bacterium]|nr:glycosyltransferase [candidate division KSB1 bacterium]RQW01319.1 MAG: glycosyltransferase [candidate division KSB1 bacterium]
MQVSVIIPTYNRADLVCQAVDSVLRQKTPADEIIVVDDGSTDNTRAQLGLYGDAIKIVAKTNGGISSARNVGIRAARFEWIAFLDSDDLWKRSKLARQKEELAAHPGYKICYTDEEWRKNGQWMNQKKIHTKYGGLIYEQCLPLCIISPSSVIIHRELFEQIGDFDESLPACEDYDLWLRLSYHTPILYIPEKLIIKRHGDWEQLSQQHSLDKYRILALAKMIETGMASGQLENATRRMLAQKCSIYLQGCEKHHRLDDIEWVRSIQQRFQLNELKKADRSR